MKILFIAPRFHTNLYFRVKALKDGGHDVYFFSLYKQNSEAYDILEPVVLQSSKWNKIFPKAEKLLKKGKNFWKIKANFPVRKDLRKKIKEINPEVVIIKNLQGILSLYSLWYARKFTDKVFLLIQTDKHHIKSKKKKFIVWVLKKFFKVKNIISPLKNILDQKDDFFQFVPFVVEAKDFNKEYFQGDRINILSIGKFMKRKDHLSLLKAVDMLKDKYKVSVTIVGEKTEDKTWLELKEYIKKNNLEKTVNVISNINYLEMNSIYSKNDLFVLPSYDEPAAYSPVEAMAAKLPVICSDTCGTKCYIEEGGNGYIFKSKDYNDLADKIEKVIEDKNKLIKMGEKSFNKARQEHNKNIFLNFLNGKIL